MPQEDLNLMCTVTKNRGTSS